MQQDAGPPPVAPVIRSDYPSDEASPAESAPFVQDAERALAARQALGVAGLDFGKGILLACPGVKPPSFDFDQAQMQGSLERSLEQLGRCAAVGRLAQSRLRLLVWEVAAGEALQALLVADGVQSSRLELIGQTPEAKARWSPAVVSDAGSDAASDETAADDSGAAPTPGAVGEWVRSPKVRVELIR